MVLKLKVGLILLPCLIYLLCQLIATIRYYLCVFVLYAGAVVLVFNLILTQMKEINEFPDDEMKLK